jgi:hypothetical protein
MRRPSKSKKRALQRCHPVVYLAGACFETQTLYQYNALRFVGCAPNLDMACGLQILGSNTPSDIVGVRLVRRAST